MATYVTSPPTQAGVADSRTSITKAFTLFAGGTMQVDYTVSSEAGFDFFRVYVNNLSTGAEVFSDSGTGGGAETATISTPSSGSINVRLEYFKDGGVDDGTDNVKVTQIRIYNSSAVLQETYNFSGTSGAGPPTGWTEILNDGTAVTGSHWTFTDTGGSGVSGTLASTTTKPTAAFVGNQTHVGVLGTTTTKPTAALVGSQTHLGVLGATATLPTFAASGTVGAGALAATTTLPTAAISGNQTHVGVLGATASLPTFAASGTVGATGISGALAATATAPTFAGAGSPVVEGQLILWTNRPSMAATGYQTHVGVLASRLEMPALAALGEQRVAPVPPSARGAVWRNDGGRVRIQGEELSARVDVGRGCSAKLEKTSNLTADFSEG